MRSAPAAFFLFGILCTISKNIIAQEILRSSDSRARQNLEQISLRSGQNFFLGYGAHGSFDISRGNEQKSWSLLGEISGGYLSLHETATRQVRIGNDQFPVLDQVFLRNQKGLVWPRGENQWLQLQTEARYSDWLVGKGAYRFGVHSNSFSYIDNVEELFAEIRFRRLVLSIGRKPLYWGQSFVSPLLLSQNAAPFDGIFLSTLPVEFPWILKYLGEVKVEGFFSRMDDRRVNGHDLFFGWRLGFRPASFFETNFGVIYQEGGDGNPEASASDIFLEVLGTRRRIGSGASQTSNATNRALAWDFRFLFSDLPVPFSLYLENHLEDCCGLTNFLNRSYSFTAGVSALNSKDPDALQVRFEFTRTNGNIYTHHAWRSGFSNRRLLLGHPIGRDSLGYYLDLDQKLLQNDIDLEMRFYFEQRNRRREIDHFDVYAERKTYSGEERRFGAVPRADWEFMPDLKASVSIGFMRTWRKENANGRNVWDWASNFALSYEFGVRAN